MAHAALRRGVLESAATLACCLMLTASAAAQNGDGLYVTVPNPLTSEAHKAIKSRIDAARKQPDRKPGVIVLDFNPNDKDAASTEFGPNYDLAEYVARLLDVKTVAYVHGKVSGHTVLPVLACQEVVCGPSGQLGEVVAPGERALTGIPENAYAGPGGIVAQVRPAFVAVAKKMYDPSTQLRKGKKGNADWFVDLRDKAAFAKDGGKVTDTQALPAAPDGRLGLFTADQLRDVELSRKTVTSQRELLEDYGLNASALIVDPVSDRPASAVRYVLKGPIDAGVREAVGRTIKDAIRRKATILILQLECSGGDLDAARGLAEDLRAFKSDDGIKIVAFIPDKAPDTATIVAMGCSEIVMSKRKDATTAGGDPAPEAEFGDFEAALGKGGPGGGLNVTLWEQSLKPLAEAQGYPPVLVDAMLKREVEVVYAKKKNQRSVGRLMTEAELQQNTAEWRRERTVKPKGQTLKLSASDAEEFGLARFTVDTRDPAEVYAKYGLDPAKVKEAAPSALDRFAEFLKNPVVTVLLVVIGFTGLILELKVPGTTVPGIVSALCFILVFWAHTQFSGQIAVLAGLLFVLGLLLILLEVFVLPGIGAAGICGVMLMLAALGLMTFNEIPDTTEGWVKFGGRVATYMVGMMASVGLAFLIARFLPNIPYANRLMLIPPSEKPGAEAELALPGAALAASLLGTVGTSVTVLRPAGTVRIGDQFVDVVSDGGFIPAGARVQVIEVEGTRIVVKEI